MKRGLFTIGMLIVFVALSVLILVSCTDPEQVELARMRKADAEARLANAEAQGTVNVLREQTNAHVESLRIQAEITKEMRDYELQLTRKELRLHREEMASILGDYQTMIVSLKENAAIAENSHTAAENSYWILIFGVPILGMNLGLLVLVIFLILKLKSVIKKE